MTLNDDSWNTKTFGECAELVRDTCQPDEGDNVPYVGLEHIEIGTLRLCGLGSSTDVVSLKSRFLVGDILFGKLRPYFRKVIRPKFAGFCSTDIMVVRAKPGIDQGFLFYWMASPEFVDTATRGSEGTKMPRAKWDFLERIERATPPLPEQRAIAHILGTLDDKIELNHQMNETLEAMAQALFKSWFVDFEPFRDQGMQDSPLGPIPRGWRVGELADVVSIYDSRRIPLSDRERSQRQGPYPYYGAAGIMDYVDDYLFDGIHVLMAEDGSVVDDNDHPVIQYVWGKFWVNNHAHVLKGANGICDEHLMLFLKRVNIRPYVTGAVQPKLNQGNMKGIPFVKPPFDVCDAFRERISGLFAKLRADVEQSATLAAIRDALLPKMLSGEIRVKDAERFLEVKI